MGKSVEGPTAAAPRPRPAGASAPAGATGSPGSGDKQWRGALPPHLPRPGSGRSPRSHGAAAGEGSWCPRHLLEQARGLAPVVHPMAIARPVPPPEVWNGPGCRSQPARAASSASRYRQIWWYRRRVTAAPRRSAREGSHQQNNQPGVIVASKSVPASPPTVPVTAERGVNSR